MNQKGLTLVEIIIAGAIIATALFAIVSFLIFARGTSLQNVNVAEATSLAQEGMEAVRTMRDEAWSSVSTAGTYYPVIQSGKWILIPADPGPINGLYTRAITIEDVSRDPATNDISSSGNADPNTKKVTVAVTWSLSGRNKDVTLTTYITNFVGN